MGNSASADHLEERLIDFAVRVIKVADRLPKAQVANMSRGNCCVPAHHRPVVYTQVSREGWYNPSRCREAPDSLNASVKTAKRN